MESRHAVERSEISWERTPAKSLLPRQYVDLTLGGMVPTSLDYYCVEELLTDEERAAHDRARRFVDEEVMQEIVSHHRAGKFPEHLTPRMGALGFFAPYLKEHGCAGLSYTAYGLIMQELERADSALRACFALV